MVRLSRMERASQRQRLPLSLPRLRPAKLLPHWTSTFMMGTARFVTQWFPMFLLGGIFGKMMDDSGVHHVDRPFPDGDGWA